MQSHSPAAIDFAPDWAAIVAVVLGVTAFSVAQGVTYPLISRVLEGRGVSSTLIGVNALAFALGLGAATSARALPPGRWRSRFSARMAASALR